MKQQIIVIVLSLIFVGAFGAFIYKSPQGDPTEFGQFNLPTPEETIQYSQASFNKIDLQETSMGYTWKGEIPCDAEKRLSITIISPIFDSFEIKIQHPSSNSLFDIRSLTKDVVGEYGMDGAVYESHSFEFENPAKGMWLIFVTSKSKDAVLGLKYAQKRSDIPEGMVIVGTDSPYRAAANLDNLRTVCGEKVGYELRLVNRPHGDERLVLQPELTSMLSGELEVLEPDGEKLVIQMHDDGLYGDKKAGDGIFYASFQAQEEGLYSCSLVLRGQDPKGLPFYRTVETVLQIVDDNVDISGGAYAVQDKQHNVMDIYLRLNQGKFHNAVGKEYKVWSEVWGKNAKGVYVPVAWVSGIKQVMKGENGMLVLGSLELNQRWIEKAGVKSSLQLRNLRVQDLDWSVVIEQVGTVSVDLEASLKERLPSLLDSIHQGEEPLDAITLDMKEGWRTKEYVRSSPPLNDTATCLLALVHGYCAKSNPFPIGDFTNAQAFTGGFGLSLSNDQFSKRLVTFIQNHPCTTAIGHSQGGMAITHTHNYYVTPLDKTPSNKRLLQSVGTPYQGTALAGSLAAIGEIFGAGCGSNNDLTYSGAKTWIAGLGNRNRVFFYYTQYGKGLLWNACNTAANAVLSWPNDGTTENAYAPLPNGNNQPSNPTAGECHTAGMNFPEQCRNRARNQQMNSFAHQ